VKNPFVSACVPSLSVYQMWSEDPIADYVRILAARSRSYYRVGRDC
jgi:hypothetical protein